MVLRLAVAVISALAPGLAIALHARAGRHAGRQTGPSLLAETVVISLSLMLAGVVTVSVIGSLTGFALLQKFFWGYFACSVACLMWLAYRALRAVRARLLSRLSRGLRSLSPVAVYAFLLFCLSALVVMVYPQMSWDAFNYYIPEAVAMLEAGGIASTYPSSIRPVETPFPITSLALSTLYGYMMSVGGLSEVAGDLASQVDVISLWLEVFAVIFLAGAVLAVRGYASVVLGGQENGDYAAVLFLGMPLLLQYHSLTPLYTDMLFVMLTATTALYGVRWLLERRGWQIFIFTLSAVLLLLTKISGAAIAIPILLIILSRAVRRSAQTVILALMLAGTLGAPLVINVLGGTRLGSLVAFFQPANALLLAVGIVSAAFYIAAVVRYRSEMLDRVARRPAAIWLSLGCFGSILVLLLLWNASVTGSPLHGYVPFSLARAQDAPLVRRVFEVAVSALSPSSVGLPEGWPKIMLIGYQFFPHLLPAVLLCLVRRAFGYENLPRLNNLLFLFGWLVWMLLLQMRSDRHFMFILPFFTVVAVDSLKLLALWRAPQSGHHRTLVGFSLAATLVASLPLVAVALSANSLTYRDVSVYNLFRAVQRNWFDPMNSTGMLLYAIAFSTLLCLCVSVLGSRPRSARFSTRACLGAFIVALSLPQVARLAASQDTRANRLAAYQTYDRNRLDALSVIGELADDDSVVADFHGWIRDGCLPAMRGRYINLDLAWSYAGLKTLLDARSMWEQSSIVDQLGLEFLILPRGSKEEFLDRLRLVSGSLFLSHTYAILYKAVPPLVPISARGWDVWRRDRSVSEFVSSGTNLAVLLAPGQRGGDSAVLTTTFFGNERAVEISDSGMLLRSGPNGSAYLVTDLGLERSRGILEVEIAFHLHGTGGQFVLALQDTGGRAIVQATITPASVSLQTAGGHVFAPVDQVNNLRVVYAWTESHATCEIRINERAWLYRVASAPGRSVLLRGMGQPGETSGEGELQCLRYSIWLETPVEGVEAD